MAEVPFTSGTAVRLDIFPEVFVGELEDSREQGQETAIDGLGQVVAESFDFAHQGLDARGDAIFDVVPVGFVPVELLDTVGWATVSLVKDVGICKQKQWAAG